MTTLAGITIIAATSKQFLRIIADISIAGISQVSALYYNQYIIIRRYHVHSLVDIIYLCFAFGGDGSNTNYDRTKAVTNIKGFEAVFSTSMANALSNSEKSSLSEIATHTTAYNTSAQNFLNEYSAQAKTWKIGDGGSHTEGTTETEQFAKTVSSLKSDISKYLDSKGISIDQSAIAKLATQVAIGWKLPTAVTALTGASAGVEASLHGDTALAAKQSEIQSLLSSKEFSNTVAESLNNSLSNLTSDNLVKTFGMTEENANSLVESNIQMDSASEQLLRSNQALSALETVKSNTFKDDGQVTIGQTDAFLDYLNNSQQHPDITSRGDAASYVNNLIRSGQSQQLQADAQSFIEARMKFQMGTNVEKAASEQITKTEKELGNQSESVIKKVGVAVADTTENVEGINNLGQRVADNRTATEARIWEQGEVIDDSGANIVPSSEANQEGQEAVNIPNVTGNPTDLVEEIIGDNVEAFFNPPKVDKNTTQTPAVNSNNLEGKYLRGYKSKGNDDSAATVVPNSEENLPAQTAVDLNTDDSRNTNYHKNDKDNPLNKPR